jgi:hypothetical protein
MKWLEQFKTPVVTVEGNRFVIASAQDENDVIDAEIVNETPRSQALARRESSEIPAQSAPKVGEIPRHSWGA